MRQRIVLGLAVVALTGCAGSPPNHYFTLSPEPPDTTSAPQVKKWHLAGVQLPRISDRPQLVVRTGPQTIRISEFDRWAEPFDDLVPRVLAQDLVQRLGIQAGNEPANHIYVVVDEFMTDNVGSARLAGRWWIQPTKSDAPPGRARAFDFVARQTPGADAAAPAALSRLLGQLADDIAHDHLANPRQGDPTPG